EGSLASEYTPAASQCQTSTCAFANAVQPEDATRETLNVSASWMPGFTAPVDGSVRMSVRLSFSSTKYGPSVSAGRTMHDGAATVPLTDAPAAAALVAAALAAPLDEAAFSAAGAHASAPAAPRSARTSRRVRTRPTGASSASLVASLFGIIFRVTRPLRSRLARRRRVSRRAPRSSGTVL